MGDRGREAYESFKQQQAEISRERSKSGRDIGPLPPIADPDRRASCERNLQLYLETYHARVFCLAWSQDHLDAIERIQTAILVGGLSAMALPRGSGKTSLLLGAAEWALFYGHRSFLALIGASEDAAEELLGQLKAEIETNDVLAEDFPEICHPIRSLGGIANRASGQLLNGERTRITFGAKELVLPTVAGSRSSGARVKVAGITGRIRGMSAVRAAATPPATPAPPPPPPAKAKGRAKKGKAKKLELSSTPAAITQTTEKIRPDLVLVDDPQTGETATSITQNKKRLKAINADILGLSGPGKKIAGFAAVTVIAQGDCADQLLDRERSPDWQGVRVALMRSMPTDVELWDKYAEIRARGLREERGLEEATAFYLANRKAMDKGAEPSWEARFNPDEASAVQHAMNLKLRDAAAFAAEYQNAPLSAETATEINLAPEQVIAKVVAGVARGRVPATATKLTGFIDVQGNILFYGVGAFAPDFTGHVVQYGTYPEQPRVHFGLREVSPTLADKMPGASFEAYLYAGLEALTEQLLTKRWPVDMDWTPGAGERPPELSISRLMIDANWGDSTAVVKQFCKQSKYRALLIPTHGRGITPDQCPMNEYKEEKGERVGWNWRHKVAQGHLLYDTNAWKSFVFGRLCAPIGDVGTLTLHAGDPYRHQLYAEHIAAEYGVPTTGRGRTVNVFKLRPNRENHWLDCLIGMHVAAAEQGIIAPGHKAGPPGGPKRRRKAEVKF